MYSITDNNHKSFNILTTKEVEKKVKMSRITIYRRRKEGKFVLPVDLGNGRIGYYEHEIDEYLMKLKRAPY